MNLDTAAVNNGILQALQAKCCGLKPDQPEERGCFDHIDVHNADVDRILPQQKEAHSSQPAHHTHNDKAVRKAVVHIRVHPRLQTILSYYMALQCLQWSSQGPDS